LIALAVKASHAKAVDTKSFKDDIGRHFPKFANRNQQNAQEFVSLFLDRFTRRQPGDY
jgi:ubiquitin C-terminal hydrolase